MSGLFLDWHCHFVDAWHPEFGQGIVFFGLVSLCYDGRAAGAGRHLAGCHEGHPLLFDASMGSTVESKCLVCGRFAVFFLDCRLFQFDHHVLVVQSFRSEHL